MPCLSDIAQYKNERMLQNLPFLPDPIISHFDGRQGGQNSDDFLVDKAEDNIAGNARIAITNTAHLNALYL